MRLCSRKDHSSVAARQDIVRELAQDGICTMSRTVRHCIFAWTKGDGLEDRCKSGRPSSITEEIAAYMDMMLDDDNELTASEIHRLIARKFSAQIPTSTIRRFLRLNLKWVVVRARTGPMISEKNNHNYHVHAHAHACPRVRTLE